MKPTSYFLKPFVTFLLIFFSACSKTEDYSVDQLIVPNEVQIASIIKSIDQALIIHLEHKKEFNKLELENNFLIHFNKLTQSFTSKNIDDIVYSNEYKKYILMITNSYLFSNENEYSTHLSLLQDQILISSIGNYEKQSLIDKIGLIKSFVSWGKNLEYNKNI